MVKLNFRALIVVLMVSATALLAGCASPARVDGMQIRAEHAQLVQPTPLREALALETVSGGEETNPLWTSEVDNSGFHAALENSLKSVGLYAPLEQGDYRLSAELENLQQPLFGASLTVSARVTYSVTQRSSGKEIYRRTIDEPYTAAFGDAFVAVERLRLANEGAIRVNITQLVDDLLALDIQ